MSANSKNYSIKYKKGIVEDSLDRNLSAFCKEKLDIRKWRAEYDDLSQWVDEENAKKLKCGSGQQPLFPELEDTFCEWVAGRRSKALIVCMADIQALASQLDIYPKGFKESQHWLDSFLQQYELSLKRVKTLFKLDDVKLLNMHLHSSPLLWHLLFQIQTLQHDCYG